MEEIQIENCSNVETKPHPHIKRNYVCIDCGYRIQNPRLYLEHRRDIHHELLTIHQCNLCVYASKHSQKLFRHQSTVHRNLKRMGHIEKLASVNSTPKSHMNDSNSCLNVISSICSKKSPKKRVRNTKCKYCEYKSTNKSIMIEHIRNVHKSIEIYQCEHCDYVHYLRDRINRHRRYHAIAFIMCKFCDFKTVYKWNMERHNRHHSDLVNGFKCEKCNFVSSTRQSITTHEATSHNNKQIEYKNNTKMIDFTENENPIEYLELLWDNNNDDDDDDDDCLELLRCKTETILESTLNRMHIFQCQKCHFKNEVECEGENGVLPSMTLTKNKRFQCGLCQQISNWKHVIERHCRLVHGGANVRVQQFNENIVAYDNVQSN